MILGDKNADGIGKFENQNLPYQQRSHRIQEEKDKILQKYSSNAKLQEFVCENNKKMEEI